MFCVRSTATAVMLLCVLAFTNATPLTARACDAEPIKHGDVDTPGEYIVRLKDGYSLEDHQKTIGLTFPADRWLHGYLASLNSDQLGKVRADCSVNYIENNFVGEDDWDDSDDAAQSKVRRASQAQDSAPWGLNYLSSLNKKPADNKYWYLEKAGKGVTVYVFDSGVNHDSKQGSEFKDFDTQADRVVDLIQYCNENDFLDHSPGGHGTSVASIIGGREFGVAKYAKLAVVKGRKTVNGKDKPNGARIVLALGDIITKHKAERGDKDFKGAVVNMSFQTKKSQALDDLLTEADTEGISLVASAGNTGYKSGHYPSSHPKVIGVGAMNDQYTPWEVRADKGSNYGPEVTIWAPGFEVNMLKRDGGGTGRIGTGTSYAAPHVAGILAVLYGVQGKTLTPAAAKGLLMDQTSDWVDLPTNGVVKDWKMSPQAMANTGNRKGANRNPPLKFINGPKAADTAPAEVGNPVCAGVGTIKWMGRDALNGVIPQFCDTAEKQGVQDKDSGSIQRTYLDGGVDKVSLSIDWPSGGDFKPNRADCIKYLSTIMDGCDGNDPVHNPLNWKHGGSLQAGIAKFNVNPLNDRYISGTCSFHVHETEYVYGLNTPGFSEHWTFLLRVDIKDGNGNIIGGTNGRNVQAGQDAANPYIYNGLYAPLSMLPEAQGGNYIQFNIGDQAWPSSQTDQSKFPRCSVGAWDTSDALFYLTGGPRARDMDCSFYC